MIRSRSKWRRLAALAVVVALLAALGAVLAACGEEAEEGGGASGTTIVGAGASFPAPLYTKWGEEYAGLEGVKLNYQSIGSGGGIAAIQAGTVDFGASDAPLTQEELEQSGLVQFPMVMGGVVVVVNLKGVASDELRLDAATLAGIYAGEITSWDDPALRKLNPDVSLPKAKINVVHRSDGSGTTWIFTHYLTAAAGDVWTAGADKEIAWPVGVGGKGNEGVAASVQQLSGSIGYVEYAYAKQAGLTTVQLKNRDGQWVSPSLESFAAAAEGADWEGSLPAMDLVLVDQPGENAWPITGASFILVHKEQDDAARAKTLLDFFNWCFENGADAAAALDYVAVPESVYTLVRDQVWSQVTAAGEPVWQP